MVVNATTMTATEITTAVRNRKISVSEIVEQHIRRIEETNTVLNAVIWPMFDEARKEALEADKALNENRAHGLLFGVPMTVKDQFMVRGTPTSLGLKHRSDQMLDIEGSLISRIRQQGAIILGKTNLPQLCWSHECEHAKYGKASNPWNLDRTPGGSSGGEASVIAAGGSPLGLGADMGGSLRVPAHCCGLHALKPTGGRLPNDDTPFAQGYFSDLYGFEGFLQQAGPVARSVEDLKLLMDALLSEPLPRCDGYAEAIWEAGKLPDPHGLHIGFYTDNNYFKVSPAIRRIVMDAADALKDANFNVREFEPYQPEEGMEIYLSLLMAGGNAWFKEALAGDKPTSDIRSFMQVTGMPNFMRPAMSRFLSFLGQEHAALSVKNHGNIDTKSYWKLTASRSEYRAKFLNKMDDAGLDILLCPPYALPAPPHGSNKTGAGGLGATYPALYNLLGMPAGVVAAGRVKSGEEFDRKPSRDQAEKAATLIEKESAGMPVGVQVVGRHWQEQQVLAIMKILESHFKNFPDYPVGNVPEISSQE